MMLRFIRRWLLFVVLFGLLLVMSPVHAQVEPALSITKIDVQNFPEVKVYLRGENLGANLSELAPTLSENGQEIPDLNREIEDAGVQIALLLDASGSVLDPGQTGEPRHLEVWNVTNRLIELGVLSQADWLAAYAPDASGAVSDIQAWTRDYQAVANLLYTYQPPENIDETPLNDLIFFALDRFDQPDVQDVPENTAKKIVLFSDGLTGSSNLRPDDAIDSAIEANVPVYTVLLGPETEEGLRNMNSIALLTGGGTGAYQLSSLEALDELWNTLAQDGEQFVLSYRSQLERPIEVLASVTLPDGASLQVNKPFPIVDPQPVLININPPTIEGFPSITKNAEVHDTPLEELDPKTMDIQVEFSWPDDFPRDLVRVEYVIDDKTEVRSEEPFNLVSFPIERLDEGDYTIRVTAIDELDIRSESEPLSFSIDVTRAAAPTPTPVPTPLPVGPNIPGVGVVPQQTINTGLIILTLIVSLLALLFALRKPAVRERVIEAVSTTVQAVTEPFRLNKGQAAKGREVKAVLTVEDAGRATSLPATMDIYAGATTRIGRTSEFAEIVIEDKRVSRLHCRMAEDPDGKLRLFDEGGASGTYVNFDQIDINGCVLKSGDIVNIGPVKFRFDYKSDGGGGRGGTVKLPDDPGNQTEPFQPIAPS